MGRKIYNENIKLINQREETDDLHKQEKEHKFGFTIKRKKLEILFVSTVS